MDLTFNAYTVILMVGPSGCGKSTLAHAIGAQLGSRANVLSSDEIRRALLDDELHKHDARMTEVSKQAFAVLDASLKALISFPVTKEFVIIDTTGLNDKFREQMAATAQAYGYHADLVLFDYKTKAEYLEGLADSDKKTALDQTNRLRRDVLSNLKRHLWHRVQPIKARNKDHWSRLKVIVPEDTVDPERGTPVSYLARHTRVVDLQQPIAFIGDVHECRDALEALVAQLPARALLVLDGDLFDKGGDTEGMVAYLERLLAEREVELIAGNHETYLAKRLRGDIDPALPPEEEAAIFTALPVLQANSELAQRFLALYARMRNFLYIPGMETRRSCYVTHAPCLNMHIGKPRFEAAMRNFRYEHDAPARQPCQQFLDEAEPGQPLHLFGHVPHADRNLVFRNKVFLDTGAVHGNALSALLFDKDGYRAVSVAMAKLPGYKGPRMAPTLPLEFFFQRDLVEEALGKTRQDYELSPDDERFLDRVMRGRARYISGTMAPCPAEIKEGSLKLESLALGLKYFADKGVDRVVLEPKYMGSRCQFYLYRDEAESGFAISRNGARLSGKEDSLRAKLARDDLAETTRARLEEALKVDQALSAEIARWRERAMAPEFPVTWERELVLDGELMPWHAWGAGLIERDFLAYRACVDAELTALAQDAVFASLDFGKHAFDVTEARSNLDLFDQQLALYAQPGPIEFKAFAVLATDGIPVDDTEFDTLQQFRTLSSDPCVVVDPSDPQQCQVAQRYFDTTTVDKHMEGVVLKPLVPKPGVAPYLKCRNESYLTLIYGYNYRNRYAQMCQTKRVGSKLALSLTEHELGQRMLQVTTEKDREALACAMLFEMKREQALDPRL